MKSSLAAVLVAASGAAIASGQIPTPRDAMKSLQDAAKQTGKDAVDKAVKDSGKQVASTLNEVPLIPRAVLFGNPDRANSQISPDGKWMSFLAERDGVMNLWVAPAKDLAKAKAVTADTKRGIREYNWCFDNQHLLYRQDLGGDENWKIYSVDVASGAVKDLTPFEDIKGPDGKPIMLPSGKPLRPAANIENVSAKHPTHVLVGLNNRNPQYHDLYKVDVATGAMELAYQNDEYAALITDDDFVTRLAISQTEDGGLEVFRSDGKGGFASWQKIPMADSLTTRPIGFDAEGKTLYMADSRTSDTARLYAIDLASGEQHELAGDPRADLGDALVHPTTHKVQAASFEYTRTEWKILDDSIKPDFEYLKGVADGEIHVQSRSQDDKTWIVSFVMDDGPVKLYRYDRDPAGGKAGTSTFLFTNRSKLEGTRLSKMNPVVITSRDGMKLVSYLTVPAQYDVGLPAVIDGVSKFGDVKISSEMTTLVNGVSTVKKTETPGHPLPLVLLVHGGPWARDSWGFNSIHQWLANRGYAVLSVNFRSSTGFGKSFINAGNREWGAKMHNDLLDAVDWAVSKGIADKNKVAIMGGSYGGYATLAGLTITPDVFACGVDIVGPSNLTTLLNTIPPYWAPMIEMFTTRVGDHRTEEGRKFLDSISPVTMADRIKRPLLIGQGANDPRVKQAESDQIVSAMQQKNIPVTYVLFPDEGHGFNRPENNRAFFAIAEAFLSRHLGGRQEPIGDDVSKSTAQIKAGSEGVPGLVGSGGPVDVSK